MKHMRLAGGVVALCAILAGSGAFGPVAAESVEVAAVPTVYVHTKLVADVAGANTTDPKLINPWGVAFFPGGAFWVSDAGTGVSTLYDGTGVKIPLTVTIPAPPSAGAGGKSSPTGQVINVTGGFLIPDGEGSTAPAKFIFVTEDGVIAAWNGAGQFTDKAVLVVDNSAAKAVYKGLAFGSSPNGNFLYATNFHAGRIEVFDKQFHPVDLPATAFADPSLPAGFAPFGIANIGGDLFVTYAKQDAAKHDDVAAPGRGVVNVFSTDGKLLRRFATGGNLNSPWGLAESPIGFGTYGGKILVGNFGDGHINVYDLTGSFVGQFGNAGRPPFTQPGLWAITFGGALKSSPDTLYYTAGPGAEQHGRFGSIAPR